MNKKNLSARESALMAGLKTYQSKKACGHCGGFKKYVSSMSCADCLIRKGKAKLENAELMAPYRTDKKKAQKQRQWRRANKEKLNAQNRRNYAKHPERYWANAIKKKYGCNKDAYLSILESQGGGCAICGIKECRSGKRLAIDHCHETGTIRGILCADCNRGIGLLRESEDIMNKVIEYLRRSKCV